MLEYELNGKIYTEEDLINAAGGKDKLPAYIKSKGFKVTTKKAKQPTKFYEKPSEDLYKKVFGFENPAKEDYSEINKTKKKPTPKKFVGPITPEMIKGEESTVAANLGQTLAKYGLTPEETGFGINRLTIRNDKKAMLGKKLDQYGNEIEIDLDPVVTGADLTPKELADSAKRLNEYIRLYGDKNYAQRAKKENPKLVSEYNSTISAPSRTYEEKLKLHNAGLEDEFKKKETIAQNRLGIKGGWQPRADVQLTKNDFDTPEKYNNYKNWKKTGQIPLPSEQKLEKFIGEYNNAYRTSKSSEFMSNAPQEQRVMISAIASEKEEESVKTAEYLRDKSKDLDQRSKDFSLKIVKFEKTPPTALELADTRKEYLALQNETAEYNKKALATKRDFNTIKAVYDTALKDYNRLNQTGTLLKQTGLGIAGGVVDLLTTNPYGIKTNALKRSLLDPIYSEQKAASKELESYQQNLQIKDIKSMKDLGRWGAGVLTQMPSSIAMAVTGEAALPLFFLSGYGSKQYEIASAQEEALGRLQYYTEQLDNGLVAEEDMADVQKQISSDKKTLSISEGQKLTSQLLAGTAEVLFEKYGTLGIIKETDNILRSIPPQEIKRQLKVIGKEMGKSAGVEAWTEGLTQLANNFGDIHLLGQDKNYFDGVPDSMAGGAFMGPGFSAMGGGATLGNNITKAVVGEIASKEEFKARNRKLAEIKKLTGLTDITGLTKSELNDLTLQPPIKKAVEELIDQIDGEDLQILDRLGKDISMEDAKRVGDLNQKLRKITKDWNEASRTTGIGDAQLKSLKDYYQKQYNEVFNERESLLKDEQLAGKNKKDNALKRVTFEATAGSGLYNYRLTRKTYLEKLAGFDNLSSDEKQKYNTLALSELNMGDSTTQLSDKEINSKARELYAGEEISKQLDRDIQAANDFSTETGLNVKVETINSEKELLEKYGNILTAAQIKEIKEGTINAFNIDDSTLAVYKPNALKNGHTSSGSHEVLHTVLSKAFKGNQEEANKNGIKLLEYLKTAQPDLYAAVEERMKGYDTQYKAYGEEVFNALSDSFNEGKVPNDNVFTQISKVVNKITKGAFGASSTFEINNINTDSGKALFDTVKAYHQKASAKKTKSGQSIRFIYSDTEDQTAEESAVANFRASKSKAMEVQKKIDNLEDQLDNGDIDYEDYESRLKIFEAELAKAKALPEEAPKPEVKKVEVSDEDADKEIVKTERGSVSSDKVQKIYDEKGLNGAQEIIDLFRPITKKLVNRRMDAPGFDRELLTDEIETGTGGILDLISKYKPEGGVPLAAFINKYLPVRAIAASRRVLDKDFSKDVTEEKGLIAEEAVSEAKEKPKYKNALESKVFDPEVLKTLSNKVLTVTRTLKNRIDAPVTLNRTITPLISEIRDEVGRLLDIDVKTAMGGKKDDQLKKWLLKNKRYVLENMTTTWLMGKDGVGGMPQAIQKQIDGKWVSYPDWVGKKIDREKTTTDQAGRTSGAELVRRLPNVANNVTDEVYLSQVLEPSGNPIRGRKESLAKAVAEESAFDIINDDLENQGPIYEALATNQERQGVEIADNFAVNFARQADRGNIKFSKATKLKLAEKLNVDISDSAVANIIVGMIRDIIKPTIYKRDKAVRDKGVTLRNKLGNDLYEELYDEYLYPIADALEIVRTSEAGKRGNIAEEEVIKTLNNVNNPNFKVISVKAAGAGSDAIDVKFSYKDIDINFEVKSGKNDRITSLNVHNYATNKKINTSRVLNVKNKKNLLDQIENNRSFNSFVQKAIDGGASFTKNGSLEVDQKLLNKLTRGSSLYKRTLISGKNLNIPMDIVSDINNRKGINYIGFGDIGVFYIGSNPLGLDVPALEGELYSKAFLHAGKAKVNGKRTLTLKVYTQLTTDSSNKLVEKSKSSIYSPESWENLFKNIPESRISYIKNIPNIKKNNNVSEAITRSLKASKTPRGISVFDFDDTVGLTKSNVLYTKPDETVIYHGGGIRDLKGIKGPLYAATDKTQAEAYAKSNQGEVKPFVIKTNKIINEDAVIDEINALGLKSKDENYEVSELNLYELIDPNFDTSLSDKGLTKLFNSLKQKGIKAVEFLDMDIKTLKNEIRNIVVFDKNIIQEQNKLTGEEFAKEGSRLLEEGVTFDFSEFSKVVDGKPGPMVEKMKKMIAKFGPENFFILTARPQAAAVPIYEFLDSIDINIPLENITGLGNSAAQAKADWMVAKAAEGYNDFYFADDAPQNVKAVQDALDVLDVKSKIQQAKLKFSKTMSTRFNEIIEENTGIENYKVYSDITARRRGLKKNKFDFYVPPSAADFELLLYKFMGKGALGEDQKQFFEDALIKPYINGVNLMDAVRQSIKREYKALLKSFPEVKKELEKLTPNKDFTYDQAMRVAIWSQFDVEIPGLSQRDKIYLTDLINNDPELAAFKDGLIAMGRQKNGWLPPSDYWDADTIVSDLYNITEGSGRKKFLGEFIENVEEIFGKWDNGKLVGPNMNKIEAAYGTNVREALEDSIYRMTNGKNRSYGGDKETAAWSSWVNGSTGSIMFLNTRSAALQMLGAVNFLNWRDNNPYNAGKAFLNQPQYWKDFAAIWNSDKLKERRGGLREDVASAEIANAAAGSKNKAIAVTSYLLKIGYTPTQLADSFAIASGGAPFYRNRINSYLKEGLSEQEAEKKAWQDFSKISDETQQSGDPKDISKQQSSGAGRLLLVFQNFTMQQSRIVKKAVLDLKNGRGDTKTNIAKIAYYLAVQNIMFSTLQQGLFAVMFGDDDDEEKKDKKKKTKTEAAIDVANGVLDSILRGTGFLGGIIATTKNVLVKYFEEAAKEQKAEYAKVVLEVANMSPPIGSKLRKTYSALQQTKYDKDLIKERGWGVMQDGRVHLGPMYSVTGKAVEVATNFPMDRLVNKVENISQAFNSENTAVQRMATGLGYSPWTVGIEGTKGDLLIKSTAKAKRKEEGVIKAKETRRENAERLKDSIKGLSTTERLKYNRAKALEKRTRRMEKAKEKREERRKKLEMQGKLNAIK